MKMIYIGSTASIIYTIKYKEPIKSTYDKSQDSFLHWKFAAAPCAILAFLTHLIGSGIAEFNFTELLWTFSIYCEAVAILPQLIVLQRYREVENLTGNYIFCMGAYRFLYILNWIYRANTEKNYRHHWVVYMCGVLQTLLYADFFYYYFKRYVAIGITRFVSLNLNSNLTIVYGHSQIAVNQREASFHCQQPAKIGGDESEQTNRTFPYILESSLWIAKFVIIRANRYIPG
jgi:hypothetical protein